MSFKNQTRTAQDDTSATQAVVVYGSTECPFTKQALSWLKNWKVAFKWVDVDSDAEAERRIAGWNGGRAIRPTLDVGGQILVHPEQEELRAALASKGLL